MASVIKDVSEMQRTSEQLRSRGARIAVVPTMGYLHQGHLKLIEVARAHAQVVVTTVFVNPTQFGPTEDFSRYPRDLERDTSLAVKAGTDYIFAPRTETMYPPNYHTFINLDKVTDVLEGKSRPGHFRGVATIVSKLFNIVKPHVAVFGQKDAQQVVVVQQMVQDLNFDIEIIVCPTVREADGLAMSSRNTYLSPEQRAQAPVLYASLKMAEGLIRGGERNAAIVLSKIRDRITQNSSSVIDYVSIANATTLNELSECNGRMLLSLAVRFGNTRLIDNIVLDLNHA